MSRHTPGPWVPGECSETLGYDCMTAGMRVGPLVLDGADYGQPPCGEFNAAMRARMLADARLISAAPDMLSALEQIRDWAEDLWCIEGPVSQILEACNAAISKAEAR